MPPLDVAEPTSPSRRRLRAAAWVLGLCTLAFVGRFVVVEHALRSANGLGGVVGAFGEAPVGDEEGEPEDLEELELLEPVPPESSEPEATALPQSPGAKPAVGFAEKRTDVRVSAAQVIAFANSGQVPRGASTSARGGCPAGIRLRDVTGYGLGVLDGDLLVQVNGAPVSERGEVVSAVLAARGRREPVVHALVLRPRTGCRHGFRVTVEQPYPSEEELPETSLTPPVSSLETGPAKGETSYGQNRALREARP